MLHPLRINDGEEAPMAPAGSLARMRKAVLDRVVRKEASVVQACRDAGWSAAGSTS
jgi:hypothetical protein